jgi:hypothetical protein
MKGSPIRILALGLRNEKTFFRDSFSNTYAFV